VKQLVDPSYLSERRQNNQEAEFMSKKISDEKLKILCWACIVMAGIIFLMVLTLKMKYHEPLFVTVVNENGQKILIRAGTVFEDNGKLSFLLPQNKSGNGKFYLSQNGESWAELKYSDSCWDYDQHNNRLTSLVFSYVKEGTFLKKRKVSQVFYLMPNSKAENNEEIAENPMDKAENNGELEENPMSKTENKGELEENPMDITARGDS
jgi:hypothetical protein